MDELEEGEIAPERGPEETLHPQLCIKNVEMSLDQLLLSQHEGLNHKAKDTAPRYLELLIHTLKSNSIRSLAIVLKALLETRQRSVLKDITNANGRFTGLKTLFYMLRLHQHSFQMTPILRTTLRVLHHLEKHGVLRGGELTCCTPHFCIMEFSQLLFALTKHSDSQVRALASPLQKLRFDMPRAHPTHDACQETKKRILKVNMERLQIQSGN